MCTLFIADLHLQADNLEQLSLFRSFLANHTQDAEKLYILGDLFEYWLGDEQCAEFKGSVIQDLRQLSQRIPVYIMHGNRDFTLGNEFCRQTGCVLLDDPCVIDLYGTPTLLTHGDLYCSNDIKYQRYRRVIRNPLVLQGLLKLPYELRLKIASKFRSKSRASKSQQQAAIMDTNQDIIKSEYAKYNVEQIIHGHTHRPSISYYNMAQANNRCYVLSDWHTQAHALLAKPDQTIELRSF